MEKYIHTIQKNKYPMSDHRLNVYRSETAKDPTLQMLIKYITTEWLCDNKKYLQQLHLTSWFKMKYR